MTHRDELLSLQARVEAQQREIDDAKSEIALLRAAHAQKTRETETLHRELDELRAATKPPHTAEPARAGRESPFDPDDNVRWSMRLGASVMAGVALVGSMMLAVGASRGACHGAARAQAARPLVTHLVRHGTVVDTLGPEVVSTGESCTIERMPVDASAFDCRIEVRCGDQTLYGTTFDTGYVRCGGREVVRDSDITSRDGDPAMTLDLARGRVVVEERVGLGTQRVEIALDPVID